MAVDHVAISKAVDKVLYPKNYVVDLGLSTLSVKRNLSLLQSEAHLNPQH